MNFVRMAVAWVRLGRSMYSLAVWAWSMEPGPMQMEGMPAAERWAASENQGAPVSPMEGSVLRRCWMMGWAGSVSMGGFSCGETISRGRWRSAMVFWRSWSAPPAWAREGVMRMSSWASARSGTMLGREPPWMTPMLRVEWPRVGWVKRARASPRW